MPFLHACEIIPFAPYLVKKLSFSHHLKHNILVSPYCQRSRPSRLPGFPLKTQFLGLVSPSPSIPVTAENWAAKMFNDTANVVNSHLLLMQ
jgi:hypothetical protein